VSVAAAKLGLNPLSFLNAPINTLRTFLTAATNFGAAGPQQSSAGPLDGGAILSSVFAGTRSFASGLFTTVLFLYFLLVSGEQLSEAVRRAAAQVQKQAAGSRYLLFRVLVLAVGRPWRDSFGANSGDDQDRV
jgi:predicted PurR-regulated permease PerM